MYCLGHDSLHHLNTLLEDVISATFTSKDARVHLRKGDVLEPKDTCCIMIRDEDTVHIPYACLEADPSQKKRDNEKLQ